MKTLSLSLILILLCTGLRAQNSGLTINATAETEVPADRISFRIQMNAEADTPREAFQKHREKEDLLVNLLGEQNIPEKNINFEPVSLHKQVYPNRGERETKIATRQQVKLVLDDFNKYQEIQITLIENGFDEFSGQFLSTEMERGEEEALKKALGTAREKAELIIGETGGKIAYIKKINYSYDTSPPVRPMMETRAAVSDGSLFSFDQTVTVSATVNIEYVIDRQERKKK